VTGVGVLLVLAGSTAQAGWLVVLAAGVFGTVVASVFIPHRLGLCEMSCTVPALVRAGDDVAFRLQAMNRGRSAVAPARVEDGLGAFAPAAFALERLLSGAQVAVEVARRAQRRGVYTSTEVTLSSCWPFGLARSSRSLPVPCPVTVVPSWVDLRSFPLLEPSSYPAEALHERARMGAGVEYRGVREYRPGDSTRSIHWRSSARRGALVVREYEEEVYNRVAIVIAGADHGSPPRSSFEALVTSAASIAVYALTTGHPVELLRPTADGGSERVAGVDRAAVLMWLAGCGPLDAPLEPVVSASVASVGRRGTVAICAPSAGRAGASLPDAARTVQSVGARAVPVVALSSTWEPLSIAGAREDTLLRALGARAVIRTLSSDKDLESCLQG
jgi:uncharacterized protein (DUF58 family)